MIRTTEQLPGKVYLIGAGPGAVDLITVRGMRLLAQADIVFADALVDAGMRDYCPAAQWVEVGKRCGRHSTAQHFINKQLVDAARKHAVVVRLKGGDPLLFGRADEELTALEAAGIDCEVVPGITAALAAAATLKQPLTKRGVARSVTLATQAKADATADAPGLPVDGTVVLYMGRDQSVQLAQQLIAAGRTPQTPVAIVEAASTPRERHLALTLAQMAQGLAQAWIDREQPCLLLVGDALAPRAAAALPLQAAS